MIIGKKWVCESKKSELDILYHIPIFSAIFRDEYDNTLKLKLDKNQFDNLKLGSEISVKVTL